MARARVSKTLGAGHQLSLVLGALEQENQALNQTSSVQWVRLGFWFELPLNLFGRAGYEYNTGDDLEGQRVNLGLGYRF
jgi:opacity protein-like surface antigen